MTAGATIMLWRVTSVLAVETKTLAAASAQPQVVVTIEPNAWSFMHADLTIENTGNATAFDISISFDPPLTIDHEGSKVSKEPPFQNVSLLRPSQRLVSWIGKMHPMLEARFLIRIEWRRSPTADREGYSYILDMGDYRHMSRLGSGDPLIKMADTTKKLQDDFHKFATGWNKLKVDLYTSDDRNAEETRWSITDEEKTDDKTSDSRASTLAKLFSWLTRSRRT